MNMLGISSNLYHLVQGANNSFIFKIMKNVIFSDYHIWNFCYLCWWGYIESTSKETQYCSIYLVCSFMWNTDSLFQLFLWYLKAHICSTFLKNNKKVYRVISLSPLRVWLDLVNNLLEAFNLSPWPCTVSYP